MTANKEQFSKATPVIMGLGTTIAFTCKVWLLGQKDSITSVLFGSIVAPKVSSFSAWLLIP